MASGQGIITEWHKHFILDYKQGRISLSLDTFLENGCVTPRNFNWLQSWHNYFNKLEAPLFCIGASHLFGEYGILNLLIQAGYLVEYPFDLELPVCELEDYV